VHVEVGSHGDGAAEVKKNVDRVEDNHDERVDHERVLDARRDEVEERQHREDSHKHVVVDDGWVASEGGSDHVTDKGHDEQSPKELDRAHGGVDNVDGTHCE